MHNTTRGDEQHESIAIRVAAAEVIELDLVGSRADREMVPVGSVGRSLGFPRGPLSSSLVPSFATIRTFGYCSRR
jgi:hypothetical protein